MTAYLGSLGSLVPVGRAQQLNPSTQRDTTITRTVGGRGVAWRSPRATRQWSFSSVATAKPNEVANLQSFVDGEWGEGPFVWVDEWAQVTNLLTPGDAALEVPFTNTTEAGSFALTNGVNAGKSLVIVDSGTACYARSKTGPSSTDYARVPVVPGMQVCVSAWVNTPGTAVGLSLYSAGGSFVTTVQASASVSGWSRVAAVGTVPNGCAYGYVRVQGSGRIAKPAVTWSDTVLPYHAGQGCVRAIVGDFDQSPLTAWGTPNGQRLQVSTTVIEVG